MSYGIYSLNSPILITDAAIIPNFEGRHDVLVIARGSLLQFYSPDFTPRYEYRLFGNVANIVPLRHQGDSQSNILIILCDLRYSVIRFVPSNGSIKTVQSGNIESSTGVSLDPPFHVANSQNAFLIHVHLQVLQYFPITPNSQLGPPVNYPIPAKNIIDFDFMISGEISRFAVLTEDFGQTTKLQVFDVDPSSSRTSNHKDQIQVSLKSDTYAIKVIDSTSIIAFKTDAATKITINSTTTPRQKSTNIYTSHKLIKFARIDQNNFIAADNGNNLFSIGIQDGDFIPFIRIGEINTPIALLPYGNRNLISISQSGESCSIKLVGDNLNQLKSETTTLMTNCGSVKKIVSVNSNEFIGICGNGFSHIIRQSLLLEEFAQIPIMGVTDVWIFNDEYVVSISDKTFLISISDSGIESQQNENLITNASTIAFRQISETDFIQVTPFRLNFNGDFNTSRDYSTIHQAAISESNVGLIFSNGQSNMVQVLNYNSDIIFEREAPVPVEEIAVNSKYVALSSWPESQVIIFSLESGELVYTIEKVNCIGLIFTADFLVLAETRDHCLFYPLSMFDPHPEEEEKTEPKGDEETAAQEEEEEKYDDASPVCPRSVVSLHCNGIHYCVIPFFGGGPNDVIVAGERPILVQDLVVKEIEYAGFKGCACQSDRIVLIHDDSISFCNPSGYAMTVHEDRSTADLVDAIKIDERPTKGDDRLNFIVGTRSIDSENVRNFSLSVVEHPLSISRPAVTKVESEPYVGMASVVYNQMKFVAVVFGSNLTLFEVSDELLQERSTLKLVDQSENVIVPFQISAFDSKFIVAFTDEFQLFELDFISQSDIRLKKLSSTATPQGSTSCISNDQDEIVAVGDELQSLVLYFYDKKTNKFSEHARNCMDFGMSICRVALEDYFCVDYRGNFFQMQIGESKNIESSDLNILSCCALGETATSMIVFRSQKKDADECLTKVLIGTKSSKYIEVTSFAPSDEFIRLYDCIEKNAQTLGRFNSRTQRAVMIDNFVLPCPIMFNFDLVKIFLEMDEKYQKEIADEAQMPLQMAREISEHIMALL